MSNIRRWCKRWLLFHYQRYSFLTWFKHRTISLSLDEENIGMNKNSDNSELLIYQTIVLMMIYHLLCITLLKSGKWNKMVQSSESTNSYIKEILCNWKIWCYKLCKIDQKVLIIIFYYRKYCFLYKCIHWSN